MTSASGIVDDNSDQDNDGDVLSPLYSRLSSLHPSNSVSGV